jgi:FkbM family methyltransferase
MAHQHIDRSRASNRGALIRIPRPIGTAAFLAAWLMPWRPAFRTRAEGSGLYFWAHWRDLIGRHLGKYGTHEPPLTAWFESHLASTPSRGLFVDVGANLGWHTVHAARHHAVEAVVAFEPDPFNAWLLDRNLQENGIDRAIVSNCAIGAQCGTAVLHRYKPSNCGRHSIIADHGFGSRTVPIADLDTALEMLGMAERRVLVMKIDVEGYEPAVIAGASRTIERTDAIAMELSPQRARAGGLCAIGMIDALQKAGFTPRTLAADGSTIGISIDNLQRLPEETDTIWLRGRG